MLITSCEYETSRLKVRRLDNFYSENTEDYKFAQQITSILSDEVTQSLPTGWQGISTTEQAMIWISVRKAEGLVSVIVTIPENEIVGFLFLSEESSNKSDGIELRLGYLFTKKVWGQGLGSELIDGLLKWIESGGSVSLISGGVDKDNIGSCKVLEKNGFIPSMSESATDGMVFYERKFGIDNESRG